MFDLALCKLQKRFAVKHLQGEWAWLNRQGSFIPTTRRYFETHSLHKLTSSTSQAPDKPYSLVLLLSPSRGGVMRPLALWMGQGVHMGLFLDLLRYHTQLPDLVVQLRIIYMVILLLLLLLLLQRWRGRRRQSPMLLLLGLCLGASPLAIIGHHPRSPHPMPEHAPDAVGKSVPRAAHCCTGAPARPPKSIGCSCPEAASPAQQLRGLLPRVPSPASLSAIGAPAPAGPPPSAAASPLRWRWLLAVLSWMMARSGLCS